MAVEVSAATEIARSTRSRVVRDQAEWDRIGESLSASALQSWDWGEFKARHGWTPTRIVCERDGEPVIAAQLLARSIGPFSVLYAPRGPAWGDVDEGSFASMTIAIDRLASQCRAAIAFIEPGEPPATSIPQSGALSWQSTGVELQPLRTIKVPIDRSDDEILSAMKSKSRYNVRLAGRRDVAVREGSLSEIAAFYELLEETSERDAFGIHSIEYYADMLDQFGDRSALLLAERDGDIAAGAIVLRHGTEAIYMFGASAKKYQRDMPTHLLQFEVMRWARDRGCSTYDLWGIPATDDPPDQASDRDLNVRSGLWGVYRFKQGFGGEIVSYPGVYERVYYPRLVSLWRRLRPGLGA